jgi:chemotaxis protein histidine kinase CheA
LITRGLFQQAFVIFESINTTEVFKNIWAEFLEKHSVRILPLNLTETQRDDRKQHSIKLAGFKTGTLSRDLCHVLKETNAKSCFIPRHPTTYRPLNYAYINYANEADLLAATKKYYELDGRKLYWGPQTMKTCHACGSPNHIIKHCDEIKNKPKRDPKLQKLYNKYRPAQHRSRPTSYADAAKRQPQHKQTGKQISGSSHIPDLKQEILQMRALLTDLSNQVKEIVTEYKKSKTSSTTKPTNAQNQNISNKTTKSSTKTPPVPTKKTKTQQQNTTKRPWNEANLSTSESSSSEKSTINPVADKLDRVLNGIEQFERRMDHLESIQQTYGTEQYNIQMEDDNTDDIFA